VSGNAAKNVDGSIPDAFVLGDDDEEEEEDDKTGFNEENNPPPAYPSPSESHSSSTVENTPHESLPKAPPRYYIKKGDTLRGIALRFGLDVSVFSYSSCGMYQS
jgi:LysM repeat protein